MATGTGILGVFLQTLQAQNLHGKIIDELENSDYAASVLKDTFEVAQNQGTQLEVLLYLENGSAFTCDSRETVQEDMEKVKMAEVSLTYPIHIPFVGLERKQKLVGYAR